MAQNVAEPNTVPNSYVRLLPIGLVTQEQLQTLPFRDINAAGQRGEIFQHDALQEKHNDDGVCQKSRESCLHWPQLRVRDPLSLFWSLSLLKCLGLAFSEYFFGFASKLAG